MLCVCVLKLLRQVQQWYSSLVSTSGGIWRAGRDNPIKDVQFFSSLDDDLLAFAGFDCVYINKSAWMKVANNMKASGLIDHPQPALACAFAALAVHEGAHICMCKVCSASTISHLHYPLIFSFSGTR